MAAPINWRASSSDFAGGAAQRWLRASRLHLAAYYLQYLQTSQKFALGSTRSS
jgi:hypothetical protein